MGASVSVMDGSHILTASAIMHLHLWSEKIFFYTMPLETVVRGTVLVRFTMFIHSTNKAGTIGEMLN